MVKEVECNSCGSKQLVRGDTVLPCANCSSTQQKPVQNDMARKAFGREDTDLRKAR